MMQTGGCFRVQGGASLHVKAGGVRIHACARSATAGSAGRGTPDDAERVDARQQEQRERQREDGVHGKADLHVPASVRERLSELSWRRHCCMQRRRQVKKVRTSTVAT